MAWRKGDSEMSDLAFMLPCEIDAGGVPTIGSLRSGDRCFAAVIGELDADVCATLLANAPYSPTIEATFYDPAFSSFARVNCPRSSLVYHLEAAHWYGSLNVLLRNPVSGDFLFLADDRIRGIFAGSRKFTGKCLAEFPPDAVSHAVEFFGRYAYALDEREAGLAFVRTYTNL
jgi:hypothetical protein